MAFQNSGSSLAAPHPTIASLWVRETDSINSGLILSGYCNGAPDTTANTYSHGCVLIQLDSGTGLTAQWQNVGSAAAPSWSLSDAGNTLVVTANTDTTTPVNVFGTGGAPSAMTLVDVIATRVTGVKSPFSMTVAQGSNEGAIVNFSSVTSQATAGVVGVTSIKSGAYAKGDVVTVVSSTAKTAGAARVKMFFTTP